MILIIVAVGLLLPLATRAKVDVEPYGFVLMNASYNSRTQADIPVFAAAPGAGEPNFVITSRQTRFGVKFTSSATYAPSGVIEIDFRGLRGSGGNGGATQAAPRLRRAFAELHFGSVDLLMGQDSGVMSPLAPTTLMHQAIPGASSSGNLWCRTPQIRLTARPISNGNGELKIQAALVRPLAGDATTNAVSADSTGAGSGGVGQGDVFGIGELSGLPWFQARLGYEKKGATQLAIGAGLHYGAVDYLIEDPAGDAITGSSLALTGDVMVKTDGFTLCAEGFIGKNIGMLSSNATFAGTGSTLKVGNKAVAFTDFEEIETSGGWAEVKIPMPGIDNVEVAGSFGIETLDEEFLGSGNLKSNSTILTNIIWNPTEGFFCGIEFGNISTKWLDLGTDKVDAEEKEAERIDHNVNLSAMLKF